MQARTRRRHTHELNIAKVAVETAKPNLIASLGLDPKGAPDMKDVVMSSSVAWKPETHRTASR
jgi:hypothetical protein